MRPAFSIITICRNEALGIGRTCESIVQQTHPDVEWIVIDGASTDETLDVLEAYRPSISKFVSEPDEGIYDAMNKGIALSTGKYLVFMNGGDTFAENEALEWVAAAPQKDLIYGDLYHDTPDRPLVKYPDQLNQGYLIKSIVPHQATFYRRELFDDFGCYDTSYQIAADYDLYVRLIEVGQVSYHHIHKPLAVFDLTGISSSKAHRLLRKRENHRVRMRYFRRYRWSLKALRQAVRNFFSK